MKKLLISLTCLFIAVGVLWLCVQPAGAITNFKKGFESKYVKADSQEPNDVALAEAYSAAKCYVCHIKGEKKTERNAYGEALSALLDKEADKEAADKIQAALDTVAAQKSAEAEDAPTFGELIASGKLPAAAEGECAGDPVSPTLRGGPLP